MFLLNDGGIGLIEVCWCTPKRHPLDRAMLLPINSLLVKQGQKLDLHFYLFFESPLQ